MNDTETICFGMPFDMCGIKTIGSYWPYATTLYDDIFRAMPLTAPQSLTPDEVYAVVAWLLHQNGIIPADAALDAQTLPTVKMPNRDESDRLLEIVRRKTPPPLAPVPVVLLPRSAHFPKRSS